MSLPTIIFVHGAWHSGAYFDKVRKLLEPKGYQTVALEMPSVGRSPPVTSLTEDIETVRAAVIKELEAGQDVVMNSHSWGGIPMTSALDGLGKVERKEQGFNNGVTKLTFIASYVLPEDLDMQEFLASLGFSDPPTWLKILDDGNMWAEDVYENMYHDVDPTEAQKVISTLRPHARATMFSKTRGAAWRKIPSAYLVCENDRVCPVGLQDMMIDTVKKEGGEIVVERLASAHSPYINHPEFVTGFLQRAAA